MKNGNLAKRVKELRKRNGLSQEELTENSGLSLRTIQRIETGETQPTGDTLKRIAKVLNVTPNELVDWTIMEDKGFLKALNLSALTFLFFPILGILVPLIMWISKKDKLKDLNKIGRDVINFEITWTVLLFLGFLLNAVYMAYYWETNGVVSASSILSSVRFNMFFLIFMYLFNLVFVIFNTVLIDRNKQVRYFPKINFVRK
ncbi:MULTISPECIES: helix-turn-helix domain-containing protein [Arenibacter]|uniref:helix-turn-helix domain-containing protein n=1 Tax=Arenibacter TaxID=178469 RepID=UPI00054F72F8|nr:MULTISPECIES: helix-turn-helix domain-containing protein [Arenibacter]GBF21238.1 transcriptional repressor DicA [Arenibacter sp. NBRC 103722]